MGSQRDDENQAQSSSAAAIELSDWHSQVRDAILLMRRNGGFSYNNVFVIIGGFFFIHAFGDFPYGRTYNHIAYALVIVGTVVLLLVTNYLTTRRLAGSGLVNRFLNLDPDLSQPGSPGPRTAIISPDLSAYKSIKLAGANLGALLKPPAAPGAVLPKALIAGLIAIAVLAFLYFYYIDQTPRMPLSYWGGRISWVAAVSVIALVFTYFDLRQVVWTRCFCARLSARLGSDLVNAPSELALGMTAFGDQLDKLATGTWLTLGFVLCGFGLLMLAPLFMLAELPQLLIITLLSALIAFISLIWEFSWGHKLFASALKGSGIALKLIAGEYPEELFSSAARWRVKVILPQVKSGSLTNQALVLALEPGDYLDFESTRHSLQLTLMAFGILGAGVALFCQLWANFIELDWVLYIPVAAGLLFYWLMYGLVSSSGRMVAMLRYLQAEVEGQG